MVERVDATVAMPSLQGEDRSARPQAYDRTAWRCFWTHFVDLVHPSCMVRLRRQPPSTGMRYYVLNARRLLHRRQHVLAQLDLFVSDATDVTLVHCADADELFALPAAALSCLSPFTLSTPFTKSREGFAIGTRSLALKHMIAMHDMLSRGD